MPDNATSAASADDTLTAEEATHLADLLAQRERDRLYRLHRLRTEVVLAYHARAWSKLRTLLIDYAALLGNHRVALRLMRG